MALPTVDEVRERCARLRDEPLLHASLGSKELFHSNLLGWATERFGDLMREVLEPWLAPGDVRQRDEVFREWRHIDLRLDLAGHQSVIVENKTFSMPREDQLERYVHDARPHLAGSPTWLLLSLIDPQWEDDALAVPTDDGVATWRRVSYRQLGTRLQAAFAAPGDFAEQVVAHEARLMLLLDDLVGLLADVEPHDPLHLPAELVEPLREVRLHDVVGKVRMQAVLGRFRRRLRDDGVRLVDQRSKVDFTNGTPLIELFATIDPATGLEAGWQFQGGQWRLALVMHEESLVGESRHHLRVEKARTLMDAFDFGVFDTALGVATGRDRYDGDQRKDFSRFAPQMIYRHRKLPTTATVGQFVDLAVAYGHRFAELTRR